jgi:hypothetical protein
MSLRKAINAMCRDCAYDPLDDGSAAQQIACCTCKSCPLHKVRPITAKSISEKLLRAYRIAPADLDTQARALITPSVLCSGDGQNGRLLDSESTFVINVQGVE